MNPLAIAAAAAEMDGLTFLRAMAAGEIPPAPIATLLDFADIPELEEGRIVFRGVPNEHHYNPIGVVHGGYAMTLLDSAMGCAVHSTLPAGTAYTSLEVKVNFVRPITLDTGPYWLPATWCTAARGSPRRRAASSPRPPASCSRTRPRPCS
jgi:acyl-coenzyme A thioesterase PaaI-like protein